MLQTPGHPELEQRLGLYRIFLKLYEHHSGLLETILELETSDSHLSHQVRFPYVQAVIQSGSACLMTNLGQAHSQAIAQPENIWVIGRDHHATITISDPRVSRHHAVIQYLDGLLYLIDLDSTNGSFINGEVVKQPTQLKDGDQIRLGGLPFTFFLTQPMRQAASLPAHLLHKIYAHHSRREFNQLPPTTVVTNSNVDRKTKDESLEETVSFVDTASAQALLNSRLDAHIPDSLQSHILDRFFKRQNSNGPVQD